MALRNPVEFSAMTNNWKERIAWCEAAGMTRQQIAAQCGLAYSSLSDIANGASKEPRGMAAVKLYKLSESKKPRSAATHSSSEQKAA